MEDNMTVDIVSFLLGGILVLIGILGGGFEVKELKVPQIKGFARLFCIVGGVLFISLGVGLKSIDLPSNSQPPSRNSSGLVYFTVRDELGEGQVSEQVRILINGREMGTLTVNEHYQKATVTVTVPNDGDYSYVIEAIAVFREGDQLREINGVGQGTISVKNGNLYELASNITGGTWLAHMEYVEKGSE
jgi:hypothetical protein